MPGKLDNDVINTNLHSSLSLKKGSKGTGVFGTYPITTKIHLIVYGKNHTASAQAVFLNTIPIFAFWGHLAKTVSESCYQDLVPCPGSLEFNYQRGR